MLFSKSACLALASAVLLATLSAPAQAQFDISDATHRFTVGIDSTGVLYNFETGTGFRRNADGYDPLQLGSHRDSWGVSSFGSGYADPYLYGTHNIVANGAPVVTANSAFISSIFNRDGFVDVLRIDQTYTFAAANVLKIHTVVTNIFFITDGVLFKRDIDWNILPTYLTTTMTDPVPDFFHMSATSNGLESPDPYGGGGGPIGGGTFDPRNTGGGFLLDFGRYQEGQAFGIDFYYAISDVGQSEADLRTQVYGLGANFLVSTASVDGGSHSALIGAYLTPEPGSIALLIGMGISGAALLRRRSVRQR